MEGRIDFEVEEFEQVPAESGTSLLRVAGRWRANDSTQLGPPALIVSSRDGTHRLDALPGPDDAPPAAEPEGSPWRGAFPVPAELMEADGAAFALVAGATVVDLPRPSETRDAGGEDDLALELREALAAVDRERTRAEAALAAVEHERARAEEALGQLARARAEIERLRSVAGTRHRARDLVARATGQAEPTALPAEWLVAAGLLALGAVIILALISGLLG